MFQEIPFVSRPWYVRCILNFAATDCLRNFSITILTALMSARILPGPDNSLIDQTFKTSFYCDFESVANIVFSFETN